MFSFVNTKRLLFFTVS